MRSRRSVILGSVALGTATAGCTDLADSYFDSEGDGQGGSGPENTLDTEENRRELVETYDDAVGSMNDGLDARNSGNRAVSNNDHSRGVSEFEAAENAYGNAAEHFADALALAFQVDHDGAAEACENGNEFARTMEAAMSVIGNSARMAELGAIDEANETLEEGRQLENEVDQSDVPETAEVANMLDVEPRGGF